MFTVVEHQQQLPTGQGLSNRGYPPTVTGFDTHDAANEWADRVRQRQRCELTQPHAMAETGLCLRRELERQPGLSRASNPRQGDNARRFDRLANASQLGLTADELRHLRRQVPRQVRTRPQRRKTHRPTELPHPLRPTQITKTMLTQVTDLKIVHQERRGRSRAHHLTAPRNRHHPLSRDSLHSRNSSHHAPRPRQCAGPYAPATDQATPATAHR